MSLANAPVMADCRIEIPNIFAARELRQYEVVGVCSGSRVRVLVRHPERSPLFAEIEIEGSRLVTLPIDVADAVLVEPLEPGNAPPLSTGESGARLRVLHRQRTRNREDAM
jgi:hypothetical protein